jgi:hypothetical protein
MNYNYAPEQTNVRCCDLQGFVNITHSETLK